MEDGGQRGARVLDVDIDVARAQRPIADERAAEIEPAFDLDTRLRLDRLREELAEQDLLGEVLRADADHVAGRPQRRGRHGTGGTRRPTAAADARTRERRRAARFDARGGCARSSERQGAVEGQREQRRRNGARQDDGRLDHRQAAKDVFAEAARADRRRDRRGAHADHRCDADPGDDRRQRQRQLDAAEQLARRHAERHAGFDERRDRSSACPATVVRMIGSSA